ncbi:hypothetical protein CYMTET_14058 [Cymbomonas tetramitiformis]|uniref:Uncharacterized protein n=1 Tax=Cymbomonas tetramitiformis TaxID=36881 RepID=A0AAE0LAS0_9CHLO|nr:hypothetical protein CYMTET_14058 [Cymbomonas tetramitiformis]
MDSDGTRGRWPKSEEREDMPTTQSAIADPLLQPFNDCMYGLQVLPYTFRSAAQAFAMRVKASLRAFESMIFDQDESSDGKHKFVARVSSYFSKASLSPSDTTNLVRLLGLITTVLFALVTFMIVLQRISSGAAVNPRPSSSELLVDVYSNEVKELRRSPDQEQVEDSLDWENLESLNAGPTDGPTEQQLGEEAMEGLLHCPDFEFGPDCKAHLCTTRVYLPTTSYLNLVRGRSNHLVIPWFLHHARKMQGMLKRKGNPNGTIGELAPVQQHIFGLSSIESVFSVTLNLAHEFSTAMTIGQPLRLRGLEVITPSQVARNVRFPQLS